MALRVETSSALLPALTGLRGVAALWVVLFHIQVYFEPSGAIPRIGRALIGHGWVAVDLFFILSGFVLMHAHEHEFLSIEAGVVGRFLAHRALRVYPTATVVLFLILGLIVADPGFAADPQSYAPGDLTWKTFLVTLALATRWTTSPIQDWNLPVWSLSVEIIGYLAFPWIARTAGQVATPPAAVCRGMACIMFLTAVNAIGGRTEFNDYGPFGIARMASGFVCGAYLARAFHLAPGISNNSTSGLAFVAAAGLCVACTVPGFMVLALISSAVLVIALAYGGGGIARSLSTGPVIWLGRISFPLYLVHMVPIKWLAYRVRIAPPDTAMLGGLLVACVAACLIAAYLLHILIERPTHRLARRLVLPRSFPALASPSAEGCTP